MAQKDDSVLSSTLAIFGGLKEEELSDDRLAPDSVEKKKRDTEKFNAICIAAFVLSMMIKQSVMAHRRYTAEKTRILFEVKLHDYLQKITHLSELRALPTRLSPEQLLQIQQLDMCYQNLINQISHKITQLDEQIKLQTKEINALQTQQKETRKEFVDLWQQYAKHFHTADVVKIPIHLPSSVETHRTHDYEGFVEMDKHAQKQIFQEVGEDFAKVPVAFTDLNQLIQKHMLGYVKQKLYDSWTFLLPKEREQAINQTLNDEAVRAIATHPVFDILRNDSQLKAKAEELYAIENKLSALRAARDANETHKKVLTEYKAVAQHEYHQFKESYFNSNQSSLNTPIENLNVLIAMDSNKIENLEKGVQETQVISNHALAEMEALSKLENQALDDIDNFLNNAAPNQLEPMQEQLAEIQEKSADLMQQMHASEQALEQQITEDTNLSNIPKI